MTKEQAIILIKKAIDEFPKTSQVSNPYLAGYVDALYDAGQITEEIRGELYFTYAE